MFLHDLNIYKENVTIFYQMKRILFMHQTSVVGGGSYCLLNIVKSLDKNRFEPVVALKDNGPLVDELKKQGVEVLIYKQMSEIPYNQTLFRLRSVKNYYSIYKSVASFKELLKKNNIDIVYLNNMMLYRYLKPSRELGVKTVIHIREHWPLDEHRVQLGWAQRDVCQYADKVIAINQYSASMFPKSKITIVYDWIDFSERYEYCPLDRLFGGDISKLKVYLFTGGLAPIKGAYEVIEAFEEAVKDDNSRLLMMGFTEEITGTPLKKKIKLLLSKIGLPTYDCKVKMLARKDSRIVCIPGNYKLKHIIEQSYCMLSYYTMPHANLAMAESIILGTPVIAAETEEALEYSCNGQAAMLFKINSRTEFIKTIRGFESHRLELHKRISEKRDEMGKTFNTKLNVDKLNKVLSELSL